MLRETEMNKDIQVLVFKIIRDNIQSDFGYRLKKCKTIREIGLLRDIEALATRLNTANSQSNFGHRIENVQNN